MTRKTPTAWRVSLPYRPLLRLAVRLGRHVLASFREVIWIRRVGLFLEEIR